ncbi:hypothetical protein [Lentzea sp. NPDC059081]|uniref:hypothetical protein n=1 Tax=Lentzea sp. NPDC059081 TaxID=3346719 RepID=UPI003688AF55
MGADLKEPGPARARSFVALFAVTLAAFAFLNNPFGAFSQLPPHAPTTQAPPAFTQAEADTLVQEASSGDETRLRDAVALPPDQPLNPDASARLRALAGLTIDATTFHQEADDVAIVAATWQQPGSTQSRWSVRLVRTDQRWKIAFTEQQP